MQINKTLLLFVIMLVTACSFAFVGCDAQPEKTEFTITYACVENATNPNTATTYKSDGNEIVLAPASKQDCTFVNWTFNGTPVTKIKPEWKQDITLVANWNERTTFNITYAGVEGATNPNTATTYSSNGDEIVLAPATKENSTFVNWTFNGTPVTKINPEWKQDITLVANWNENNCHIQLVWDLSEDYRFYFVNEPYSTSFYLFGKLLRVAPEVHLIYGEDNEDVYLPYYYPNFVQVTGFDSQTAGMKTVHIHAIFQGGVDDYGQPITYEADTSFDIEVKEYDSDRYGYTEVPDDLTITWPNGYSLTAYAKNPELVAAYNWMDSMEAPDHAEKCSHQSYSPYDRYAGSSAFTNTFEAPSASYNKNGETLKLLTIYEDLTRVYTDEINITIEDLPETQDDFAQLCEYVFSKGETLDLAELGIGSGTIQFHDNGTEFTFTNVDFTTQDFISDYMRSSLGFEYFFSEEKNVTVHLVGNNYLAQPYYRNNGYGIAFTIQHLADGDENCLVTIDGEGTLTICGGGTAIYTDCPLEIDTAITITSYLDRRTNAINAGAIHLTDNAVLNTMNTGTVMLAMDGNIRIEENAQVHCVVTMPHMDNSRDMLTAIHAAGNITIKSKYFYLSARLPEDTYGKGNGMDSCILIESYFGDVCLDGVEGELHIYAMVEENAHPKFDTAIAIATGESEKRSPTSGNITIKNCNLIIDIQAQVFNTVYGIYAIKNMTIQGSNIDMNLNCISGLNGLYCSAGNIEIIDDADTSTQSVVTIVGHRTNEQAYAFGVFADDGGVTVDNSALSVTFNKGIALVALKEVQSHPASYDEDYQPVKLVGFDDVDYVSIASLPVSLGEYYAYETVYKPVGDNFVVSNSFSVDNRI